MTGNRDVCGIGRCKSPPDMSAWSVPICQPHWNQCCEEMPENSSLLWLRKKAKAEWRGTLPEPEPAPKPVRVAQPAAKPVRVAQPAAQPASAPVRRVVEPRKPVRVAKPVRIAKP